HFAPVVSALFIALLPDSQPLAPVSRQRPRAIAVLNCPINQFIYSYAERAINAFRSSRLRASRATTIVTADECYQAGESRPEIGAEDEKRSAGSPTTTGEVRASSPSPGALPRLLVAESRRTGGRESPGSPERRPANADRA